MISTLPFGRTGHASSRIIFGAAGLGRATPEQGAATLQVLLDRGINHIDTSLNYHDSEPRVGEWMKEHRSRFFLATKTASRKYDDAKRDLESSLQRLCVDYVDSWQFHNLIDNQEWEAAFAPDGVLKAAIEAREQGLVRHIGVTGHGFDAPVMHRRSLERFDFDSVLVPCNYVMMQDARYAADFGALLELARERHVAVQLIKAAARRPWGDRPRTRRSWYEPLEDPRAIELAVRWVLQFPDVFVINPSDVTLLPLILDAVDKPLTTPSMAEMEQLVRGFEIEPVFEGNRMLTPPQHA